MNENKNKARMFTVCVAIGLIVIICGISLVLQLVNKRNNKDSENNLQAQIIEYANITQSKDTVTATEIIKPESDDTVQTGTGDAQIVKEDKPVIETADDTTVSLETTDIVPTEPSATVKVTPDTGSTTAVWHVEEKENLSTEVIDLSRQMSEMKGYWEVGNMEAVEDLAYLPRYRAASLQLVNSTKYYYYGDTDDKNRPNGKGLAMYTDNQYYYGDWVDGVRSGSGMWIKYYVYTKSDKASKSIYLGHSYSGNWSGDLPNGEGAEHYDYIEGNMQPNIGYNRNFLGNFKNGLYDGDIYITDYYSDGNVKEWNGKAKNGVWISYGNKDKMGQIPVIVEVKNKDNYQWMKYIENKNQGINGIISSVYTQ